MNLDPVRKIAVVEAHTPTREAAATVEVTAAAIVEAVPPAEGSEDISLKTCCI